MSHPHPTVTADLGQLTNLPELANFSVEIRADKHEKVPSLKANYVFRRGTLSDFICWFHDSNTYEWLWIGGPTGSGKSTFIRAVAAIFNIPLWDGVAGHERLEPQELISQRIMVGGDLLTVHGPLVEAMKHGGWFVLHELDRCGPSLISALNEIGEGVTIVETGEFIVPHPDFRLIVTANSMGAGDDSGLNQGVVRMDLAFMDRFYKMRIRYADEDTEMAILAKDVPELPAEASLRLVKTANLVRNQFSPVDAQDNWQPGTLDAVISTRSLVRWAKACVFFFSIPSIPDPVSKALDRAVGFGCSASTRTALHQTVQRVFGDDQRNPPVTT